MSLDAHCVLNAGAFRFLRHPVALSAVGVRSPDNRPESAAAPQTELQRRRDRADPWPLEVDDQRQ
jgi:hypothetical protein